MTRIAVPWWQLAISRVGTDRVQRWEPEPVRIGWALPEPPEDAACVADMRRLLAWLEARRSAA